VPRLAPVATLLALACAACTGCGLGDRERDAAAAAGRFQSALEREDGRAACRELSAETARTLEQQEQAPCDQAILDLDLPRDAPRGVATVYLLSASVDLRGGAVTFLDEEPAGWKVAAAGCLPTEPGHPYDCELEG
jgi:hypothetical protein